MLRVLIVAPLVVLFEAPPLVLEQQLPHLLPSSCHSPPRKLVCPFFCGELGEDDFVCVCFKSVGVGVVAVVLDSH
jgi:hypothetical protein